MKNSILVKKLSAEDMDAYIAYLKCAIEESPDMMWIDSVDEAALRARFADPFFQNTVSLVAFDGEHIIGRIEYHFYGCLQDGYRMAYVDWLYVLRRFRHNGVAQRLFEAFEAECRAHSIDQYFLLCAENPEADRFYGARQQAELNHMPVLRKTLT